MSDTMANVLVKTSIVDLQSIKFNKGVKFRISTPHPALDLHARP